MVQFGDTTTLNRLPKKQKDFIRASAYYLNNRERFYTFINSLFIKYKDELAESSEQISCSKSDNQEFKIMTHQKIVRDYLSIYTPYRGLLLYHGLGSGKTCSAIAIAEGLKSDKQVIVMTPASLRRNFIEELKKCGDPIYKKNQFWEFVQTNENVQLIPELSRILNLSEVFINKQGGAWMVNIKKPSNFETLSTEYKHSIDLQINEMIRYKYQFINYNGMRTSHLRDLTSNFRVNPFDNKVIIIDESHNFVSRIVNKLKKPDSLSFQLYEYLMSAENVKIILLTGTPMINYPNELAILFNILRGYIKTWNFPLNIQTNKKVDKEAIIKMFSGVNVMDQIEYKPSLKILTITRNPFGFMNKDKAGKYNGVTRSSEDKNGEITNERFEQIITSVLKKNDIEINTNGITIDMYKALPDELDKFSDFFLNSNSKGNITVKNDQLFKRRIMGLTSYFKSAQEQLMPRFNKETDLKVIRIPMSDYQFGIYEKERIAERKLEKGDKKPKKNATTGLYEDSVSTYRIFSRAACNFVFPKDIPRPKPTHGDLLELDEDMLDAPSAGEKLLDHDGQYEADDITYYQILGIHTTASAKEIKASYTALINKATNNKDNVDVDSVQKAYDFLTDSDKKKQYDDFIESRNNKDIVVDLSYDQQIKQTLDLINLHKTTYLKPDGLEIYSPKFLNILENIIDSDHVGSHLIYSQFRTLEGIGVIKYVLEANGFAQFKLKRDGINKWVLDRHETDLGKPMFVLYTGTEDVEEKELIRNIFNSNWENVPDNIVDELKQIGSDNHMGNIIKVFMITSSGAEGISLRSVRYVHITEPYWHPVRVEQVIGRARRICSHEELPKELRTVEVFLYLMTFSERQRTSEDSVELRIKDKSKIDNITPVTSDELLYEISTLKENISNELLKQVKESAIDCAIHASTSSSENLKCFSFGKSNEKAFSYLPSITAEEKDASTKANTTTIKWKADIVSIEGREYALNKKTMEVYDLESFRVAQESGGDPILVGKLITMGKKFKFERI